ncbi:MAG: 4a-hydroxytetrahydrobiopterin dehydratase [Prolixibacteraceae bacterium]|nr:4a-hydroxytetrahydrobiopterin dehydratase [Prolixibacteraceae bacterium]
MKALPKDEVSSYLSQKLTNWRFEENTIERNFRFKTFADAFSFMTAIALEVEKMDHHPDWSNSYNKVGITLSTHSAKGVTLLDLELAEKIDRIYTKYEYAFGSLR